MKPARWSLVRPAVAAVARSAAVAGLGAAVKAAATAGGAAKAVSAALTAVATAVAAVVVAAAVATVAATTAATDPLAGISWHDSGCWFPGAQACPLGGFSHGPPRGVSRHSPLQGGFFMAADRSGGACAAGRRAGGPVARSAPCAAVWPPPPFARG